VENLHKTQDKWSFWLIHTESHTQKKRSGRKGKIDYQEALKKVYTFSTVEEFWRVYNNTPSIEEIMPNTDYMLFKEGIRPEWEDEQNKNGGKWVITFSVDDKPDYKDLEQIWIYLQLGLIGRVFDDDIINLLNGAVYTVREMHHRISIWVKDNMSLNKVKRIGNEFRRLCNITSKEKIIYQVHIKALMHQLDNDYVLEA